MGVGILDEHTVSAFRMKTLIISSSIVFLIMYLSFFQVKINTNAEETQPGTDVELTVEAKPNSYVGILGVDQSVLLLKSGNDITEVNGKIVCIFHTKPFKKCFSLKPLFQQLFDRNQFVVLLNITVSQNKLYTNFCCV